MQPEGSSARVLHLWREGTIDLVSSEETLREAELVLGAGWLGRIVRPGSVEALLQELRERAVIVEPAPIADLALKDRGDLDLVEAAVAGGARYVVTSDREVLMKRGYGPVEFIDSGEFLRRLGNSG